MAGKTDEGGKKKKRGIGGRGHGTKKYEVLIESEEGTNFPGDKIGQEKAG